MSYGIIKGNKHSYRDFGLTIKSKKIGSPKKKKIKEEIPFMNGSYDYSLLYGEQTYSERSLEYTFNLNASNKIAMNVKKTQVLEWLNNGVKEALYDDAIPGFYFMAEVEDDDFSEDGKFGELTVKFTAYPFMIAKNYEGSDIWDDFNFELDYAQDTKFAVEGEKEIEIYNLGTNRATPTVKSNSNFDVIQGNITYKFTAGITTDWRFMFEKGLNKLTLKGTGTIEFIFRKEVL